MSVRSVLVAIDKINHPDDVGVDVEKNVFPLTIFSNNGISNIYIFYQSDIVHI